MVRVCVAVSGDRVTFTSICVTARSKSETHMVRRPPPPAVGRSDHSPQCPYKLVGKHCTLMFQGWFSAMK